LAPSLKGLFASIDFLWPARDRRTDGWYRSPQNGISIGHNPGRKGLSHAIDVDKDGINPMWIITHITRRSDVMYYIIWDMRVWSTQTGWDGHPYDMPKGGSTHRDHLHIEIRQNDTAESFGGPWFGGGGGGGAPGAPGGGDPPGTGGFGPADPRDYRDAQYALSNWAGFGAGRMNGAANNIAGSRNF
jgi:hypothetical protein